MDPQQFLKNQAILLPQTNITYTLKIERVLLRLRFPYFIELAKESFGVGEAQVLELVCLHGQSSLKNLEGYYEAKEGDDENLFHQYFSNLYHVNNQISIIFFVFY